MKKCAIGIHRPVFMSVEPAHDADEDTQHDLALINVLHRGKSFLEILKNQFVKIVVHGREDSMWTQKNSYKFLPTNKNMHSEGNHVAPTLPKSSSRQ